MSVPSPCINVCRLGELGWCEGCYRTLREIAEWTAMSDDQKRAVLAKKDERRRTMT